VLSLTAVSVGAAGVERLRLSRVIVTVYVVLVPFWANPRTRIVFAPTLSGIAVARIVPFVSAYVVPPKVAVAVSNEPDQDPVTCVEEVVAGTVIA
jgi:hypothetical protein